MESIATRPNAHARSGRIVLVAFAAALLGCTGLAQESGPIDVELVIRADQPGSEIDRNIYGHFAEHLGRCIYEGIWVGEGSPIPNTRGIRNDVVAALRQIKIPVLRWPGGCFADEYGHHLGADRQGRAAGDRV